MGIDGMDGDPGNILLFLNVDDRGGQGREGAEGIEDMSYWVWA
jgi:hypothetical protein